ncbi:peptidoglycan D,D-transpeptidase FtsI family protein [Actinoalloteichus hymeniacidonis]|uniref:Cell division protein FtsI/penicillin-binding protein 2 n=1 Tax=Actinoalloteichus hymeniacidonis TaxID=340345 RepID=A0AAC9HPL7_9PSEU|nr:penicillin-binding protein 2 [Actinoalloteichus hymeniacidonis]AOS62706.1 cell division protein FtsI/penicillin-binding protein 2 [Actinoalloteichus hymeniacidonis]MBB5909263.1 cell division protein FtsI (penicillin-binding protein 3) [Actinoalloteichus hymeniacidonis]
MPPHRGRTTRRPLQVRARNRVRSDIQNNHRRLRIGRLFLVICLLATSVKLVEVQVVQAGAISEGSERQRRNDTVVNAERGAIFDRNGSPLAISIETRMLFAQPSVIEEVQREEGEDPAAYKREMVAYLVEVLGDAVDEQELIEDLFSDRSFVYLVDGVRPSQAEEIRSQYPEIGSEYRARRSYPGGELASSVLGFANWRPDEKKIRGMQGLESSSNDLLAGEDGLLVADMAEGSRVVIPGSSHVVEPAVPGSDLVLTLDSDLQFVAQQQLTSYIEETGAEGGSLVVLEAETGEVHALVNDQTYDPNNTAVATPEQLANPAVSNPFEPGSVNKVVTVAAAIEDGLLMPDDVLEVPGSIEVADRTISDAWPHGVESMTATGVLARSSNVGTLMMADEVGEERFVEMLDRFGLGRRTEVGLPGESAGRVPPREEWSGSTFGNLPIGQGLSMTVLQMAGMYQALANDGVRIPPRIIDARIDQDGERVEAPRPTGVKVVSPETARTVRDMLRAVTQDEPGQRGTGSAAALEGYQIAGKTGTAQQPDPETGGYSQVDEWITFAGILPADDPRFVVAVMLDAPDPGTSAAPLFRETIDYLTQRHEIPLSPEPSPIVTLTER